MYEAVEAFDYLDLVINTEIVVATEASRETTEIQKEAD